MKTNHTVNQGVRIGSMLLDHMFMTMIAMVFSIPYMITQFITAFEPISHEQGLIVFGNTFYFCLIGFGIYFLKDSIRGRSLGKRILKIQVVNHRTGEEASPLRCFVRNLFIPLWMIEVIVTLISPSRRIGDFIAGTEVVPYTKERPSKKLNYPQLFIAFLLSVLLIVLMSIPIQLIQENLGSSKIKFVENSYNQVASDELVQLFEDELGTELTADARIYDEIEGATQTIYISLILIYKNDQVDELQDYEEAQKAALSVLNSRYPAGNYEGQIKYHYKEPGRQTTRIQVLHSGDSIE